MRSRRPDERTAPAGQAGGGRRAAAPASPYGLLALQRAAGNHAVAGLLAGAVAQRAISHKPTGKKAQTVTWKAVSKWPEVVKADELVAEVIRVVADSKTIRVQVSNGADLVNKATALADTPDRRLIAAADTLHLLQGLVARWSLARQDLTAFEKMIDQRTAELGEVGNRITTGGLDITMPANHKGYSVPAKFVGAPATMKGREQGKFKSITHSTSLRSKTTSSVNAHLLGELSKQGQLKAMGGNAGTLQICPGCGGENSLESFEVDHQVAFADIKQTFFDLAEQLTNDPKLRKRVEKQNPTAFDRCFDVVVHKGKGKASTTEVIATAEALHRFSNDVDNLMRICRTCNGAFGKSDMNYLKWYRQNPMFGARFIAEYLEDDSGRLMPRAKGGIGWGQAAREWFNTHYFPVLKDVFDLRELTEAGRTSMIREAGNRVAADRTSDPVRKRKFREDAKQDKYSNRFLTGSARVLTKVHTAPGRAPMRSGSPERQVKAMDKFVDDYERDRKRRRTEETSDYQLGHTDGEAGVKPAKTTPEYQKGHDDGTASARKVRASGYEHGVTGLPRAYPKGAKHSYDDGFDEGAQRRQDVHNAGVQAGKSNADLDLTIADPAEVGYAGLLMLYMTAYNQGRAAGPP